ncbi:hypothetical protein [Devosia sp.]|uniref:hypothetical protein n=1 Tax=Devosia sp. TaxID=1871048 RepID=UPI0035B42298
MESSRHDMISQSERRQAARYQRVLDRRRITMDGRIDHDTVECCHHPQAQLLVEFEEKHANVGAAVAGDAGRPDRMIVHRLGANDGGARGCRKRCQLRRVGDDRDWHRPGASIE